jgi:hypothetical protein
MDRNARVKEPTDVEDQDEDGERDGIQGAGP